MVQSAGGQWEIINASRPKLAGTQWTGKPEYCPALSVVAEPDVVLPGVAVRTIVQAEIERAKVSPLK